MKKLLSYLILPSLLFIVSCQNKQSEKVKVSLIPQPETLIVNGGASHINSETVIFSEDKELAETMQQTIETQTGVQLEISQENRQQKQITITVDAKADFPAEGYSLEVKDDNITIVAKSQQGAFWGMQTLRQLLPFTQTDTIMLSNLTIKDAPRFAWRGVHIDVGRHLLTKEDMKRTIRLMALYKYNKLHWHLTEDQGWRIEIKSYPKLTSIGAWRKPVGFALNQERGMNKDDGSAYGGFFTQEDVKEIVAYAAKHHITVVPEIEFPGHSTAALAAYPEFSCNPDEKKEVGTVGGVYEDGVYCAGNEETFTFAEKVLDEVLTLFPSTQIHIGGDEAPKKNWRDCEKCQSRIKTEKLADEFELQAYFVKRLNDYLKKNDREMIGWDEVLEGGMDPSVTIMSWRGVTPGIEAAEIGHDVIMTPGSYTYANKPQSHNAVTQHTGAVTSLKKMYSFEPIPKELPEKYHNKIIGVEICNWSEGTPNINILEYKLYPRALAIAEVGWSQKGRNYTDFYQRLQDILPQLEQQGVKYGARSYQVDLVTGVENGELHFDLSSELPDEKIYYTLDGTEPTKESPSYTQSIKVNTEENSTVKACMFKPDGTQAAITQREFFSHKALGKKVSYTIPYSDKHSGGGELALTDGLAQWQGFEKRNIDVTLDLGETIDISEVKTNYLCDTKDWVWLPKKVIYEISTDGEAFKEIFAKDIAVPEENKKETLPVVCNLDKVEKARYIRIFAENIMQNPDWHGSAGGATWLFLDEILVK